MLIIRDIKNTDTAEILEMMKAFYSSPACLHTVPEKNFENTLHEAIYGNGLVRVLVLEEEANKSAPNIVGYAHFVVSWNNEAGGRQIWFDELYLKDCARGKGYGTQVFEWIEKNYPDLKRIRLEATIENKRAISLYSRLGFSHLPYYQMCKDRIF